MIVQVNKILCKRLRYISSFLRYTHNEKRLSGILYPLGSRKLLKVSGDDASVFLQGLITNDMKHFDEGAKSMYAMFLNNKGRVLYDTLIYKWEEKDSFMLECDKDVLGLLQKHLKIYKLKRPIDIVDVNTQFKLWVLISHEDVQKLEIDIHRGLNIYKDPRLVDLGFRVLSSVHCSGDEIADTVRTNVTVENSEEGYKYLRYKLGVNEGVNEIPPGSSFPLEVNCDYLHGVSFHKGCYIGQELTARVHHTGVVRKRVMPIKFSEILNDQIEKDSVISASNNPKLNLGKLKAFVKDYGLGLVRVKEALDAKDLKIGNYTAEALKPSWWPIEAPKEKTIKDQ